MTMQERERDTRPAIVQLREYLEERNAEFVNALPSHIKPEYFQRATLTALAQNPKLLNVDRRSLFNALIKCAQDGLIPDGRQAALVIYKTKDDRGTIAQYLPMVAGIRKLVQQSGEITRFDQQVVHEGDDFEYELGDQPHIRHRPKLDAPPGRRAIAVYSVAQWRDGSLSREIMTVGEIEKVRASSRAAHEGPWESWWDEMAKKTIAKRHAKTLPMSPDAAEALARDDELKPLPLPTSSAPLPAIERRPRLSERLENLGPVFQPADGTPRARRGRPRKGEADTADEGAADAAETDRVPDLTAYDQAGDEPPDELPNPLTTPPTPDYLAGVKDFLAGRAACLNHDIKDDPQRLLEWQRGFDSQKRQR